MKTDAQLQHDIVEELNWEPSINATHIDVAVKEGVVTLSGYVPSLTEKWTAEYVVKGVAGVKAVADDLEVRLPGASERTDSDIARAAVNALEWNTSVPHDRITVTVRDGWITLEGSVDWPYHKTAAEDAVRHLMGVKGVTNALTVQPKVTATEISTKIAEAFKRNAALEAQKIWVETEGSKVILRGNLHSWLERAEAERVASAAPGVTEVENHISVTP
ncbi:MAG: BON domain-containing protein [Deltaproteobacteria bacterium]|nr:BON domain-containing protein [Deltaproteobacteria bacterium]